VRWSKGVRAYIRIQSRKLANVGLGTKKVPTLRKQSDGVKRCVCVLKLGGYVESPNLIFNEKDVPKPAAWNLKSQLAEIAKVERDRVKERQFFAGITKPLKTGFRRALDRELDAALETLWRSGRDAAGGLIRLFRKRYRDGYELANDLEYLPERKPLINAQARHAAWPRRRATFGNVTLRFGKHRGKPLADIPADYLIWVLRNCSRLNPYTREAIEGFLRA